MSDASVGPPAREGAVSRRRRRRGGVAAAVGLPAFAGAAGCAALLLLACSPRPADPAAAAPAAPASAATGGGGAAAVSGGVGGVGGAGGAGGVGGAGGAGGVGGAGTEAAVKPAGPPAEHLVVKVLSVRPHDPTAYTQGLVWDHGKLYESAGLYSQSQLRELDPATGEVRRKLQVPPGFFAEGLAQVGDRLVQLTWKEGAAFVYDARKFERVGEHAYQGEGWGLCYDGRRLVMSDGSARLTFRDPQTFAVVGGVDVQLDGRPRRMLNELECVDGAVWANVWMTDEIVRIDPATGRVTAVVDAAGLLAAGDLTPRDVDNGAVLNGIAYDPVKKTFLITGKLWPKMFEVTFVPAPVPAPH